MKSSYIKELCEENGVVYEEFKNGYHIRVTGGIAVDVWPKSQKAWIVGTDKSFLVESPQEVMDVANLKKFPEGVKWQATWAIKKAIRQKYINTDLLCPTCHKKFKPHSKKSFTEKMVSESDCIYRDSPF